MITVEQLRGGVESLHARLPNAAPRIEATVLRAVQAEAMELPDDPAAAARELAIAAASLVPSSADLLEATAGLQRLACDLAPSFATHVKGLFQAVGRRRHAGVTTGPRIARARSLPLR